MADWLPRAGDWKRWLALPARERWLLARLVLVLPVVDAGVAVFGLGRVRDALLRFSPAPPLTSGRQGEARAVGHLVDLAARRSLGQPACLPRSLTLWWLLRRRGINSTLRIGVRTADGRLEAHAWVEHDGQVVNDAADVATRFAPFEGVNAPAFWSHS